MKEPVCAAKVLPSPINVLKISLSEGEAAKSELQDVHNASALFRSEHLASWRLTLPDCYSAQSAFGDGSGIGVGIFFFKA